jgi:hypothetical protein
MNKTQGGFKLKMVTLEHWNEVLFEWANKEKMTAIFEWMHVARGHGHWCPSVRAQCLCSQYWYPARLISLCMKSALVTVTQMLRLHTVAGTLSCWCTQGTMYTRIIEQNLCKFTQNKNSKPQEKNQDCGWTKVWRHLYKLIRSSEKSPKMRETFRLRHILNWIADQPKENFPQKIYSETPYMDTLWVHKRSLWVKQSKTSN